ncbi:Fe2+ transport system protein B [Desulfamplus magnetovallimortis]|uniref:Ferrous iron transport protein B n=2 Tax=Desulfamplus magnetovallimortis TaxID=1246637 RepID=L0R583_9BACT|nr:ferrous iron transport protein B [Desulfamplus magnetovallimortis]AET24920.1 magnetosome protein [Desulfamplus magnetovallimortis BW-1]CCO06717.1 Fe2+ transport system protein B [Desulfamplus magnetovallimortis BW-1]SLM32768.1 Fe2+ transport system protein B [Desulfamplus magnetovallimortis]
MRDTIDAKERIKKAILVGLPNTGKTVVFNNLTGEYNLVANCPFTTIEPKRSICRIGNETCELTDTPGIFKIHTYSRSEMVTRDILFSEKPDVIIQCIDAGQLKQSLTLTADLLEMDIPLVICLNAIDETSKKGIMIDSSELSRLLSVEVVESIATRKQGLDTLKDAIVNAINRPAKPHKKLTYSDSFEEKISSIKSLLPEEADHKRLKSQLILTSDPFVMAALEKEYDSNLTEVIADTADKIKKDFKGNFNLEINRTRNQWIDNITDKTVHRQKIALKDFKQGVASACRHPVFGVPILFFIIYIMFMLVVHVANTLAGWMEELLWVPVENLVTGLLPSGFWHDFLIGDYGILSLGVANALITVLPILSVFFIMFNTLEDMGYIPNLTVLTRRIFSKLGLSGASVMPLVLGFGCKTMATMTTKSLQSRREKYISIYLIAFAIPCAAQMGLNMSILGRMGTSAFLIVFSVLFVVEITAGVLLNLFLKKETRSCFIQELPPIRMPEPKAVLIKTYYKLYWFLKESLPVFIYAALALFALDKSGILMATKTFLSPVIKGFLGLPLEMVDALILCMARHEAAAGLIMNLIDAGKLNYVQCIVAVTITTMFVPCFANIMAMIHELKMKNALSMTVAINFSSFIIAGVLNWALLRIY